MFDWRDYLTLAERLAREAGDEAAQRTAISRAYYAALGRAAALLRSEGVAVSPLRTHATVWRAFKHSSDARRSAVGMDLDWLRLQRNLADYADVFEGDLSDVAGDAVELAASILRAINDIQAAPK